MNKYAVYYRERMITKPASKMNSEMHLHELKSLFENLELRACQEVGPINRKNSGRVIGMSSYSRGP